MSMFCFQCQETAKGTGCTTKGICGKTEDVANLQDLLVYVLKGISFYSTKAREKGIENAAVNHFIMEGLFVTITNANFDRQAIIAKIQKGLEIKNQIALEVKNAGLLTGISVLPEVATWTASSEAAFDQKALTVGVLTTENEDIRSLRELIIYGIKGMAALR